MVYAVAMYGDVARDVPRAEPAGAASAYPRLEMAFVVSGTQAGAIALGERLFKERFPHNTVTLSTAEPLP